MIIRLTVSMLGGYVEIKVLYVPRGFFPISLHLGIHCFDGEFVGKRKYCRGISLESFT